jgi:hypothetical protein
MTLHGKITAREIERETATQVILLQGLRLTKRRQNKRSGYANWHDTWEDAHAFLVAEAGREVEARRLQLEQAKGRLGQIKGMRPQE